MYKPQCINSVYNYVKYSNKSQKFTDGYSVHVTLHGDGRCKW